MTQVAPSNPLTHFKFLSFDIYGTLIDWESGIANTIQSSSPVAKLPATHPLKSREQLCRAFERHERALQIEQPGLLYSLLLAEVYRRTLADAGVEVPAEELDWEAARFADGIGDWPAFPDTVAAMKVLKKHYRLAPLSNVDRESFSRTLAGPLKGVEFDAIYTAQVRAVLP